jgi:CubicO group peptidase (beta-lactamase class C family)
MIGHLGKLCAQDVSCSSRTRDFAQTMYTVNHNMLKRRLLLNIDAGTIELEAFLDDLVGRQREEHHIAGAAIAVVKDGKLFFAKGYGFADLEEGIPLTPNRRPLPRGARVAGWIILGICVLSLLFLVGAVP